jgi:WD40 repeat protein
LPNVRESDRKLPIADAPIRSADFSKSGDRLALGLGNGQISSWRWSESDISLVWQQNRHKAGVSAIDFSPDSTLLLSTGMTGDSMASFSNAEDGRETRRQSLGSGGISDGRFAAGFDRLVFARSKGAVVMDYTTLETIASLNVSVNGWASRASFLQNRDQVLLAGGNRVFLFDISTGNLLRHACRIAGRSITDFEWTRLVGADEARKISCGALQKLAR